IRCSAIASAAHPRPRAYSALLLVFFRAAPTTQIYTLSLHDALPISSVDRQGGRLDLPEQYRPLQPAPYSVTDGRSSFPQERWQRSEEHTSELQSRFDLVCRLLLEKKKKNGCSNFSTVAKHPTGNGLC